MHEGDDETLEVMQTAGHADPSTTKRDLKTRGRLPRVRSTVKIAGNSGNTPVLYF